MLPSQASRRCNGTAEVLPSVSKVAGVWRSLSWCLESVMLWRGIMGSNEIWRQVCQWFGFALRLCSWSRMLAPGKIHAGGSACTSPSRTSWSSILYRSFLFAMLCSSSFCCIFICTNPKQTLLMSARSSFHWGMSTFFGDTFDVLCFHMYKLPGILWKHVCAAHSIGEKPCHDHTLDLLCFHMYKPQSNLNSRQRRKFTVAARKKDINWTFL